MSTSAAEKILAKLKNRTNINNINYSTTQQHLTTSIVVLDSNEVTEPATSSSTGLASLSASQKPLEPPLGGIGTLPANWRGVKLDLFQNGVSPTGKPKLKIKASIIVDSQKESIAVVAALNSPIRHMYRGSDSQGDPQHWITVKTFQKNLKKQGVKDYRASKFYLTGKQNTLENLCCFVWFEQGWNAAIIRDGIVYEFLLEDAVSEAFQKANGIATAYYGHGKQTKWVSLKDLGI